MVPCMIKVAGRCISGADPVMCAHNMQEGRNLGLGHKKTTMGFCKKKSGFLH
jgi:hypothetical protein